MKRLHRASLFLAAALATGPLHVLAQQGTTPAPPPGGGGTPTTPAPGTGGTTPGGQPGAGGTQRSPVGNVPMGQDTRPSMMDIQRPVFLSGRVMMADGGPPPEPVTIELVCQSTPRPYGYTNMKGQFSISLGDPRGGAVFADASVGSISGVSGMGRDPFSAAGPTGRGITERDLMGCELRASLPGYRSDVVNLSGRRVMDNPDVGVIILHPLANVAGYTFSITTANAPKDAKKAYEKGLDLMKKKKLQEAEAQLQKAVSVYPKYAVAWYELGRTLEMQKKDAEAKNAYKQSIEADAKFINPHLHLMGIAGRERNWEGVLETSQTVLKLNPFNFPQAWFYNSVANYNLGRLDDAEKSAREAMRLDPQHRIPKISQILGVILAEKRDYSSALEHMRGYLMMLAPDGPEADMIKKQVAELERLSAVRPPQP